MTLRELIRSASIIGCAGILSAEAAGPYAFTQPHWAVTSTLNGMAGPNGLPSTAWFEWGETTAYGQTTAPVSVGESTGVVRVSATVSNLILGQVYHGRLVVSNAAGVAFGKDEPLITPGRMKVALLGSSECSSFPVPISRPICFPPCANNYGTPPPPPVVPPGVSDIVGISPGGLVLRSDGVAFRRGTPVFSNVVAVAGATPNYTVPPDLGLRADGTIVGRGWNVLGGDVPPGLDGVVAIARGSGHSLALRSDGTVVAWGHNGSGQTNVPPGLSNVVAIAAGSWHNLALRIDGAVVAWGYNTDGQTNVPPELTNVVAVSASEGLSSAVRRDGTVVIWPKTQPDLVSDLTNVVAAMLIGEWEAYDLGTLALHSDGTITETGFTWETYWRRTLFSNIVTICNGFALGANQAPVSYSYMSSIFGPENQDSVVSLQAFDANGDALSFRIAAIPTSGALYQFQNGGRGSPIVAPDTFVTDREQRVRFAPDPMSNDLAPSFTFLANDGELDSSPIPVRISITPAFPRISMERLDSCSAIVRFVGNTNQTYQVWASTNLLDWQVLGDASWWDSPVFSFTDYHAKVPARFYKVSTP